MGEEAKDLGQLHPVFDNEDAYNAVYDLDRLRVREKGWCWWWKAQDGRWHLATDIEKKGSAVCGLSYMQSAHQLASNDLDIKGRKCVACANYDKLYLIAMRLLGVSGTMKGDEMMADLHSGMSRELEAELGLDHPHRRKEIAGWVRHCRKVNQSRKLRVVKSVDDPATAKVAESQD